MNVNATINEFKSNLAVELNPVHVYAPIDDDGHYSLIESMDWESAHQLIDRGDLDDYVVVDSINGNVFTIVESCMVEVEG